MDRPGGKEKLEASRIRIIIFYRQNTKDTEKYDQTKKAPEIFRSLFVCIAEVGGKIPLSQNYESSIIMTACFIDFHELVLFLILNLVI
jgi:hypothetical protein